APCMLRECPIDHRCMTGVTVDEVYQVGLSILSRRSGLCCEHRGDQAQRGTVDPTRVLDGYTIFLDRDGTLNEDPGFLKSAPALKLLPGVATAPARLTCAAP